MSFKCFITSFLNRGIPHALLKHLQKSIGILLLSLLGIGAVFGQNIGDYGSAGIGPANWTDPASWVICNTAGTWVGSTPAATEPTAGDNIWILLTHSVQLDGIGVCNNLIVEGEFLIKNFDFTVNGNTTVSGSLRDNTNLGDNLFVGKVTLTNSGTWDTQIVTTASHNRFHGGIHNDNLNPNAFKAGAANLSHSQIFSGSPGSQLTFYNDVLLNDNTAHIINQTNVIIGEKLNSLTILVNGIWENDINSNLSYAGSTAPMQDGTLIANSVPNTINYTSTGGQNVLCGIGITYHHLILSNSGIKNAGASITVNGDLTINDLATFTPTGVNLKGNWIDTNATGGFNSSATVISFSGSIAQTISCAAASETFERLEINNTSVVGVILNDDIIIGSFLTMQNGNINVANSKTLIFDSYNTNALEYTTGIIIGKVQRKISAGAEYHFPVGTQSQNHSLRFTSLGTGILTIEYFDSPVLPTGLPIPDDTRYIPALGIYNDGYWSATATGTLNSNDYNLSLDGNGFPSHTINANTRILKRDDGGNWGVQGTHVPAVGSVCKRNGLTSISATSTDFALAQSTPLITTQPSDAIVCPEANTSFTLTATGGTLTYQWYKGVTQLTDGGRISGATTNTLSITSTILGDAGNYHCTVSDGADEIDSDTKTLTVGDNTKPALTAVADRNENLNASCEFAVPDYTGLTTASDNCTAVGSIVKTQSPLAGTVLSGHNTSQLITLTANDGNGNTENTTFTITLKDVSKPALTAVAEQTRATNIGCTYVTAGTEFDLTASSDNCGITNTTYQLSGVTTIAETSGTSLAGIVFNKGETTVVWKVYDFAGNFESISIKVIVNDNEKPVIIGCTSDINVNTEAGRLTCDQIASWTEPTATDNCDGAMTYTDRNYAPGATFPVGTTIVTYKFKDSSNNESTCSFKIIVSDNTVPVITGSIAPSTVEGCIATDAPAAATTTAKLEALGLTITDACTPDDNLLITSNDVSAGTCPVLVTRTYTVTDSNGNASTATQIITISDDTNPTFTVPADIIICRDSDCSNNILPIITGDVTDENDNCYTGLNAIFSDDNSNLTSCDIYGFITRTWTLTDGCANITSKNQIIWVEPVVTITSPNDTICSGTATNIAPSSNQTAKNGIRYTWTVADNPDVTGEAASVGNGNNIGTPISQTLVNTSNTAQLVRYILTPHAIAANGTNSCAFASITVDIWVEPVVTILANNDTLCNKTSTNILVSSPNTTTNGIHYTWTASFPPEITGASSNLAGVNIGSSINQLLENTSLNVQLVEYTITPWTIDILGNKKCSGTQKSVFVYVNPTPQIMVAEANRDSICYSEGTTLNITTPNTSVIGTVKYHLETTYNAGTILGVAPNGSFNISNLIQNLVNTTNVIQEITYKLTPFIENSKMGIDCENGTSKYITFTIAPELKFNLKPKEFIGGKNIRCFGESNGSIKAINIKGGFEGLGYSILWKTGETIDSIYNKKTGIYSVTIKDKLNCKNADTIALIQPAKLTHTKIVTGVQCNGGNNGAVNITVAGGAETYPYRFHWWGHGSDWYTEDISSLYSGYYNLQIADTNGCIDGETDILVKSPVPFSWGHNKSKYGDYNISCTGANDGILNPTFFNIIKGYQWTGPNGFTDTVRMIKNLKPGIYTLTVRDNNGCFTTGDADTIFEPTPLVLTPDIFTYPSGYNVECYKGKNGKVIANLTGGHQNYEYIWSTSNGTGIDPGEKTQETLGSGSYIINIKDKYQYYFNNQPKDSFCSVIGTVTLTEPPALQLDTAIHRFNGYEIDCHSSNTGSINTTISGGFGTYSYKWGTSDGAGIIQDSADQKNLTSGTYNLTVTYGGVCPVNYSIRLHEPSPVNLDSVLTPVSCYGLSNGTISINPSGGVSQNIQPYTYLWSTLNGAGIIPAQKDQANLKTGDYQLKLTDGNNCDFNWNLKITQPDSIKITTKAEDINCSGAGNGKIKATVSGGTPEYNYKWSDSSTLDSIINITIGDYALTVTDKNNCEKTIITNVKAPNPLKIDSTIKDVQCNGFNNGEISIIIHGGRRPYHYSWSTGDSDSIITDLSSGTYRVSVTDYGGCVGNGTYTIKEPLPLGISSTKKDILCHGDATGEIHLTPTGGTSPYDYTWSNNAIKGKDATMLKAGSYEIVVQDANLCPSNTIVNISEPSAIAVNTEMVQPFCPDTEDGKIEIAVSGGNEDFTYNWSNDNSSPIIENVRSGIYFVTITDGNDCERKDTIALEPLNQWCIDIPTAFSPNDDGSNDTWEILGGTPDNQIKVSDLYPEAVIEIFNRWGILIYKSQPGYPEPWDGMYKGNKLPIDSYYYVFDLRNGSKPMTGNVTIIR